VPSIFVRHGPGTSARRPLGRRNRPGGRPERTTLEWAIRNPDLRLRGTPGTRQPPNPSGLLYRPTATLPRLVDSPGCPQYPQGRPGRRAIQELRKVRAGRANRDRADYANISLSRRDMPVQPVRCVVIHRLLRCPAHTEGGVVVRRRFYAFDTLSTENFASVNNLNGA
jgi:hypothetical protein